MLTAERRRYILDAVQRDGKVLASEIGAVLGVSEDTIRRDLRELADAGMVVRVHGGALPVAPVNLPFRVRQDTDIQAKDAIARAAAAMIQHGQVAILDGGTTNLRVARNLSPDLAATVVTNCPHIAVALADHPHVTVVLVGGRLLKGSQTAVGPEAVDAFRTIRADISMLAVCGIHPDAGMTSEQMEEVPVKRAMISGARQVVALATSGKLGVAYPFAVGPLSQVTHLITGRDVAPGDLEPYRSQGLTVLQA